MSSVQMPSPNSVTESRFLRYFDVPATRFADHMSLAAKVYWIFWSIFSGVAKAAFFVFNPNLFTLGFIGGIISDQACYSVDKVKMVWNKQSHLMRSVICAGAFLALPVVLATVSFFWAAEIGNRLWQDAQIN